MIFDPKKKISFPQNLFWFQKKFSRNDIAVYFSKKRFLDPKRPVFDSKMIFLEQKSLLFFQKRFFRFKKPFFGSKKSFLASKYLIFDPKRRDCRSKTYQKSRHAVMGRGGKRSNAFTFNQIHPHTVGVGAFQLFLTFSCSSNFLSEILDSLYEAFRQYNLRFPF